jgi:hypothetical protein
MLRKKIFHEASSMKVKSNFLQVIHISVPRTFLLLQSFPFFLFFYSLSFLLFSFFSSILFLFPLPFTFFLFFLFSFFSPCLSLFFFSFYSLSFPLAFQFLFNFFSNVYTLYIITCRFTYDYFLLPVFLPQVFSADPHPKKNVPQEIKGWGREEKIYSS